MRARTLPILLLCAGWLWPGCATRDGARSSQARADLSGRSVGGLSHAAQERILALDPEHVTEGDVSQLLLGAPAPRIINIHGGLLPIKTRMNSFARFLIGMGYPEASLLNPRDGSYSYGYYDDSDMLAGAVAWYYEHDGLRPMLMGHSLGGIQALKILHKLAGHSTKRMPVYDPLTESKQQRYEIRDPLTGTNRPVVGLQVSYATSTLAGGLGRIVPKEWNMNGKLREIPDSVQEFTGFQKGMDLLGGDFLGYGPANEYRSTGTAVVRNVRLPSAASHTTIPDTQDLLKSEELMAWIHSYRPSAQALDPSWLSRRFGLKGGRILWAAEVWYGIKKHWVIELQCLIRAKSPQ